MHEVKDEMFEAAKISLSVRLLARLLELGRASLKIHRSKVADFFEAFLFISVRVNSTLQLLNLKSGYEIELELQNNF